MEQQALNNVTGFILTPVLSKKILSLYSRGLSIVEIQDHLIKAYQVEMPLPAVSMAADSIHGEYRSWQEGALDDIYPIVYLDSMSVKFREGTTSRNQAVLFAVGIDMDGNKCPLGLWTAPNEDKHAWLQVIKSLARRGIKDVFIACVYGQHGIADALQAVLPRTETQLCVVRLIEHALNFVGWKDRKAAATALRAIYAADSSALGATALQLFMDEWDARYPWIGQVLRTRWDELAAYFAQPAALRETLYATNAILSLHRTLRKVAKRHGAFTDADDLLVRLYLAELHLTQHWGRPLRHWKHTINTLAVKYGRRAGL